MISRPAVLIHVTVLCLSLNCLFPQSSRATGWCVPKAVPPAAGDDRPLVRWEVKGWGRTQAEAEKDAIKKTTGLVQEYLKKQNPSLVWTPTPEFVRNEFFKEGESREVKRGTDPDQEIVIGGEQVKVESWVWPVEVSPGSYARMLREDAGVRAVQARQERESRSQERMLSLARLLALVVAALLAVVGYIRLDEWTRGSYSRWLAVVGAGFLAAVLVGLWFSTWPW